MFTSITAIAKAPLDPNFALKREAVGIKLYRQGHYQQAFEYLSQLAPWGYKDSQYILAFMFLKGQHVQQSTLVGMGWLAVAAESGIKQWTMLYQQLYQSASEQQQRQFEKVAEVFIQRYGMKTQRVSCRKTQVYPSKKWQIACTKGDYFDKPFAAILTEDQLMSFTNVRGN
jgi:TPR repeat protein